MTVMASAPRSKTREPEVSLSWLIVGSLIVAAIVADLGPVHRFENGDSLLPVLVSLERWTPYFWGQDRFGMLLPLIAAPVDGPLANLLLQRGLGILAGLGAIMLLARYLFNEHDWIWVGSLSVGVLVVAAPDAWQFLYWSEPYGLGLALALAGMMMAGPRADARPSRWMMSAGVVLVSLSCWVNLTTPIPAGMLVIARAVIGRFQHEDRTTRLRRLLTEAGLLAGGLIVGLAACRIYGLYMWGYNTTNPYFESIEQWPQGWRAVLDQAWIGAGTWAWIDAGAAALGVALLSLPRPHKALRGALLQGGAILLAAAAYGAFTGALRWVALNGYHYRYAMPSIVVGHVAAITLLSNGLSRFSKTRKATPAIVLAIPLAAIAVSGSPSLARVRADLDRTAGRHTADILASGCNLLAGDYWSVWPATWHANLVGRERGITQPIWGLTHRSGETAAQWMALPSATIRVCSLGGDKNRQEADRWLQRVNLRTDVVLGQRPSLTVLRCILPPALPGKAWDALP